MGHSITRLPALLALALPGLAGIAYLTTQGAPQSYWIVNSAALAAATVWIMVGRAPGKLKARRLAAIILLALLFVPLVTGPSVAGISRWLPLGALTIHAGMVAIPALVVLAARDPDYTAPIMLAALFAASLQPDAASGFALTFAAAALHDRTKDWKVGVTCIIGFIASIAMSLRGELPPAPFVERIFIDLLPDAIGMVALLVSAMVASFLLVLKAIPFAESERYALAGTLFGFAVMALISHYPTPLVGYGAAPILGYGLALGLMQKTEA